MQQKTTAPGAPAVMATKERIEEIKAIFSEKRRSLLKTIGELNDKEEEISQKLPHMSVKLYGQKEYHTKKSHNKKYLLAGVMTLVAIAELPLNLKAFEILGASQLLTYILAVFVGIACAVLAEFGGFCIMRAEATKKFMMGFFGFMCSIGGLCIIWQVAVLRHDYLVHTKKMAWDATSQVVLAGFMYFIGIVTGYLTTTQVKNKKLEDTFIVMKEELVEIQAAIKKLQGELNGLPNLLDQTINMAHKEAREEHAANLKIQHDEIETKRKADEQREKEAKKRKEDGLEDEETEEKKENVPVVKSKKQIAFEEAAKAFEELLTSAGQKVKEHQTESGDELRATIEEDMEKLETEFRALEELAAYWSGSKTHFSIVESSFNQLKKFVSEKA